MKNNYNNNLLWQIEALCHRAWPSIEEKNMLGWILRYSNGTGRRVNSANPLGPDCDLNQIVGVCEEFYRSKNQPPRFRVLSFLDPSFDSLLKQNGYIEEAPTLTLYGDVTSIPSAQDEQVALTSQLTEEWLEALCRLQRQDNVRRITYRQIIEKVTVPCLFASLNHEGRIAASCYGAIHNDLLCIETVVTDEALRGKGFASRIILALLAQLQSRIKGLCIQVLADNVPALALYQKFNLQEIYSYHYRTHDN
jgi:GNAT superfamily N-acetyltransferase